jgi:hypothetical protein
MNPGRFEVFYPGRHSGRSGASGGAGAIGQHPRHRQSAADRIHVQSICSAYPKSISGRGRPLITGIDGQDSRPIQTETISDSDQRVKAELDAYIPRNNSDKDRVGFLQRPRAAVQLLS